MSNNIHNQFSESVLVIPLTSKNVTELEEPLEVLVNAAKLNNLDEDSKVIISSIGVFAKKFRLRKFVGFLGEEKMQEVTRKLIDLVS